MKNRALTTVLCVLGAAALAVAAQQVTLKRTPKAGETTNYKMTVDLNMQGTDVHVTFDMVQKVTKVEPDGSYVVTEQSTNQVVTVGGNEMPNAGGDETSTTYYAADGRITKVESAAGMGDEHRMGNLTIIVWPDKPVTVGSKWTAKSPADKDKGTLENDYSFEVAAKETVLGHETLKIVTTVKEVGGDASSSFTTWVDTKTGKTVKSQGELKNVPIMGMPMDAKFLLEMKL